MFLSLGITPTNSKRSGWDREREIDRERDTEREREHNRHCGSGYYYVLLEGGNINLDAEVGDGVREKVGIISFKMTIEHIVELFQ